MKRGKAISSKKSPGKRRKQSLGTSASGGRQGTDSKRVAQKQTKAEVKNVTEAKRVPREVQKAAESFTRVDRPSSRIHAVVKPSEVQKTWFAVLIRGKKTVVRAGTQVECLEHILGFTEANAAYRGRLEAYLANGFKLIGYDGAEGAAEAKIRRQSVSRNR